MHRRHPETVARLVRQLLTSMSALITLAAPLHAQRNAAAPPLRGRWTGTLRYDSVSIDFDASWSRHRGGPTLSLFNGQDSISSTVLHRSGDSLTVEFAHLATRFRGVILDGTFTGLYENPRRNDSTPVTLRPAARTAPVAGAAPRIDGTWILPTNSPKGEKAWRFVVRQRGAVTTATILRVDGDAGALTGTWRGDRFVLTHFDGTRPAALAIIPQPDSSLALEWHGPRGPLTRYVAYRPAVALANGIAEPANFATHTRVRDPDEPFAFRFPDVNGAIVSNTDERFAGKVVLVNVTGSWCPNCHDEAPYLASLSRKYRAQGLEVVALDFEEPEQLADLTRLKAFIAKYGIDYTYLVAGQPKEVLSKLPQAVNLNTWPATFFLGRNGTVRAVRTGFAARASGAWHDSLTHDYEAIVQGLLKEPVPARARATSSPSRGARVPADSIPEAVVARVHRATLTVDAHIDIRPNFNAPDHEATGETVDAIDLPKLERGDQDVSVVALFAESLRRTPENRERARLQFARKYEALKSFVAARPDRLAFARSFDEAQQITAGGRHAIVLSALNTLAIDPDTSSLVRLYDMGVRVFGFAHVGDNDFAHSSRPSSAFGDTVSLRGGLTSLGKDAVSVLNRLGVILDVSQLTPAGVFDVLRLSSAPVIASHSALRSRVDVPRNLSNAEVTEIAARGGVIHIVAFGPYLRANPRYQHDYEAEVWSPFGLVAGVDDPTVKLDSAGQRKFGEAYRAFSQKAYTYWTLDDFLDTVDAAVKLVGVDHVGLSSDFNHGGGVQGYRNVGEAPNVTRGLLARGYSESDISKLWGGNFVRVWRRVEEVAREQVSVRR